MPEWKPAPAWVWEYSRPLYRGVLVTVHLGAPSSGKQFAAYIETPLGPRGAPHLFATMPAAQRWVEQAVERLVVAPEGLERRRTERRQDDRRRGGRRREDWH